MAPLKNMRHFLFFVVCWLFCFPLFAQEMELKPISFDANFFYGSILEHNPDIQHLVTGHPTGFFLAYNRKTYGFNEWERRYNFPSWGFSMLYQNMHNEHLGDAWGVYGHINWYFLNRHLMFSVGQGVAYNTSPFDNDTNYYNNAYGSHLLSSTYLKGNFLWENIWKGLGAQAGVTLIHYSNGNFRSPNNSTNTFALNVGLNYQMDHEEFPEYNRQKDSLSSTHAEPIKYNFVFRSGVNESDVIGMGQKPFYILSAYADKRINYKSAFQVGVDVFFSTFLKEEINFRSIAYPEEELSGDEDYKRIGVFVGHEWRFNRVAFVAQLGYYVYWPYEFENRVYNRLELKRYIFNDNIFATVSVHAHWAKAEAVEFGIGYRL